MTGGAVRLAALERGAISTGPAAFEVLLLRARIEVRRSTAKPHAAEVIKDEPVRDRTDEQFVGRAVRRDRLGLAVLGVRPGPIPSLLVDVSVPQPAAREFDLVYAEPEALRSTLVDVGTSLVEVSGGRPERAYAPAAVLLPQSTTEAYFKKRIALSVSARPAT
jgi:hypothetical protein